jgi:hypothetical protein
MNWPALFSLRVWFGAIFVGLIAAILPALLWPPLGTVAFILGAGWTIYFQVAHGNPLYCPACKKRVKIGATACHHCGRATV